MSVERLWTDNQVLGIEQTITTMRRIRSAVTKDEGAIHGRVALPKDQNGQPVFEQVEQLGIYIDTTRSGSTGKILFEHVTQEYPRKKVYEPPTKFTEFEQSKRIKRYWRKARN
jgi:hypothetical protein